MTSLEERERARLLAGLLLVVVGFGTVTTVAQLVLVPSFFPGTFIVVTCALALFAGAWGLSRTRHYRVAATIAVVVPLVATTIQGLTEPNDVAWWAFMLLGPLFATMFFSTRTAGAVSVLASVTAVSVLLVSQGDSANRWVAPLAFHCIYTPLLITAAWHRSRLERMRQRELAARDAALAETRRLEAVGRLAGGVAHDFNNLLTVVTANAELLRLSQDANTTEFATEILAASNRGAALTRQLLAFAKKQPHSPRPVDLQFVVTELKPMLKRLVGETVQLELTGAEEPLVVVADSTQLEQVVLNLVTNARQAMPRGGVVTISLEGKGDLVVLTVRDTGVGMDDATRARIFEPFFTTRQAEGGTGLGLASTRSIVEQSGGRIEVDSAPGQGSTFRLVLPRVKAQPAKAEKAAAAPASLVLRVLLVDDDDGVRRGLERLVGSRGVTVVAARNAEEALRLAATSAFDVLVTDVVMPGMSGPELAAKLRERTPTLPVVFISGHHEVPGLSVTPGTVVLDKPLRLEALLATLQQLSAPTAR